MYFPANHSQLKLWNLKQIIMTTEVRAITFFINPKIHSVLRHMQEEMVWTSVTVIVFYSCWIIT